LQTAGTNCLGQPKDIEALIRPLEEIALSPFFKLHNPHVGKTLENKKVPDPRAGIQGLHPAST
jgi:hypothetical protein